MRVLIFHPARLPPRDYGGVERVVLWLAKGLQERGHEVYVAALAGSRLPPGVRLLEIQKGRVSAFDLLSRLPPRVEVVHFMAPPEAGVWERLPCAGLLTVHGNGELGEIYPENSVFLSADHAKRHGARCFVYNGIDPDEFCFNPKNKKNFFLFLSKTIWRVKNLAGAIRMAGKAKVHLRVAGGQRPFLQRALLGLRAPGSQWVGAVAGAAKARLLSEAQALVFPVTWPEPFGLVVAEALISGTPVFASPMGSLPELLPPRVGRICGNPSEWKEALSAGAGLFAPEACRAWAIEKFHYKKMVLSYETLYQRVASGAVLQDKKPIAANWREAVYDSTL